MRATRAGVAAVVVLLLAALAVCGRAQDVTPAELVSRIVTKLINDNKLIPASIPIDQGFSGITIKSVEFGTSPTVQSLNITSLHRPSTDLLSASATTTVSFPTVKLYTSLGNVDIGTTVVSLSLDSVNLQIPCSSSTVSAQIQSLTVSNVQLQNPSSDWVVKLVVKIINQNPILGPLISKLIPFPISFDLPEEASLLCVLPIDGALRAARAAADQTPSEFLVAMLNKVIQEQADTPISVSGCAGTLRHINLCDTATKTAKSDAGAIIPCEGGCNTAYGLCIAGTNACWGPCYAACKVLPWCHTSDCDSKCGRNKCGSMKDSCISDCYRKLTWHGGAGLDSISGVGDTLKVSQLDWDPASGTWVAQLRVSPTARLKFFCDPVVPSWQYASSGLGDWTITLAFTLKCDTPGKITDINVTKYSLAGFDVGAISGVFGAFKDVPGFGELMGDLNDSVQGAIYNAVGPTIRDTLVQGLKSLCPVDTMGITIC